MFLALLASTLMAAPSPARLPPPRRPADASLSPAEYVALGFPAPDRTWDSNDFRMAADVLKKIAATDVTHLPRFGSPRSGQIFAALVARRHIAALEQKAQASGVTDAAVIPASIAILAVYLRPVEQAIVFDDELAELSGFQMLLTNSLVDEAARHVDKTPASTAGFAKMQSGLARVMAGACTTLEERVGYRVPSRRRLTGYLAETLPRAYKHETELQRAEGLRRVETVAATEQDVQIRTTLLGLVKQLRARPAGAR